jgi:hypothetical protein
VLSFEGSQEAEFEVAKGRDTGVGTARLTFWGAYHQFEELTAASSTRPPRTRMSGLTLRPYQHEALAAVQAAAARGEEHAP